MKIMTGQPIFPSVNQLPSMTFPKILSVLALVYCNTLMGQVYDPTMDPGLVRGGVPWDDYSVGFGPRNLIPNGNFNYLLDPCDGTYGEGAGWSTYLYRWQGTQWNASSPSSMIEPGTPWPYDLHFYCDFDDINFSHPAAQLDFHGGYLSVELIQWQPGNERRNYILVTLAESMSEGVEYAFSMDVAMAYRGTATNPVGPPPTTIPALNHIGAVLLNELPDSLQLNQVLEGLVPFVETPVDAPVEITDVLTLQDTVIGTGQRYLVVGVFSPLEDITFNPTPNTTWWYVKYMFDNFKLYRAHCGEANGLFAEPLEPSCPGGVVEVTPMYGTEPFEWTVDGMDAGTSPSISVTVPTQDTTVVRMVSGTGLCKDTTYKWIRPRYLEVAPMDTALFCDDPMVLDPAVNYVDVITTSVDPIWTQVDGPFSQEVPSWNMSVELPGPGTYVLQTTYNGCTQNDTAVVQGSPLLVSDDGLPLLLPEVRPEHCVNMNDGSIIVHDAGFGVEANFDWFQPPMPLATDSVLELGEGVYQVRVWDQDLRCETWSFTVDLMLDSCAMVEGTVVASADQACTTPDDDDPQVWQTVVALPSGNVAITNAEGHYALFVPPGTSSLVHEPIDPWTGNRCGNGQTVSLAMAGATGIGDFVDTVHVPVSDLAITWMYGGGWVIGTETAFGIGIRNLGELPAAMVLRVVLPLPFIASPSDPDLIGMLGDTTLYDLGVLQPGAQRLKTVFVPIPVNTDLIGTTATVYAQVQPVVDETMLANNERSMDYAIVGAYDPNDKQVSPRGRPEDDLTPVAEREFTYTVRFQNTGNYPATRVHITDTLHPLLDASSLRLVYSSHNVDAFVYQGVLHLDHQGIMLPDSTSDPEGSQGMVVFALRAIPAADLNDAITNTANIYFDLNPPIITNTVRNLYGELFTGLYEVSNAGALHVRPTSSGNYAYSVSAMEGRFSALHLMDARGRVVRELAPMVSGTFSMYDLPAGLYVLVARTTKQRLTTRFVHQP